MEIEVVANCLLRTRTFVLFPNLKKQENTDKNLFITYPLIKSKQILLKELYSEIVESIQVLLNKVLITQRISPWFLGDGGKKMLAQKQEILFILCALELQGW